MTRERVRQAVALLLVFYLGAIFGESTARTRFYSKVHKICSSLGEK